MLLYGIESLSLSNYVIKNLQTTEANIIKSLFGIGKKKRTTDLLKELRVDKMADRIKKLKFSFFGRLYENKYTKELLEQLPKNSTVKKRRSVVNETADLLAIRDRKVDKIYAECKKIIKFKEEIVLEPNEITRTNAIKKLLDMGPHGVVDLNELLSIKFNSNTQ